MTREASFGRKDFASASGGGANMRTAAPPSSRLSPALCSTTTIPNFLASLSKLCNSSRGIHTQPQFPRMKVCQNCESCLQNNGDYYKLTRSKRYAPCGNQSERWNAFSGETLQAPCDHAQVKSELHQSRSQRTVIAQRIKIAQGANNRLRDALNDGHTGSCNDQHAQETELEASPKQSPWIDDQQGKGTRSNGIQRGFLPIKHLRRQIKNQHQRGSPDRSTDVGENCVSHREKDCYGAGGKIIQPQATQQPKCSESKDSYF